MTYHTRNLVPEEARLIAEAKARRARMETVQPIHAPVFDTYQETSVEANPVRPKRPPRPKRKTRSARPINVDDDRLPQCPSIKRIIHFTAEHYAVLPMDIESRRRTVSVALPRHVAFYLARVMTRRSLPDISRRLGKRDHTTGLHSYRKIAAMLLVDDTGLADDIAEIRRKIEGSLG